MPAAASAKRDAGAKASASGGGAPRESNKRRAASQAPAEPRPHEEKKRLDAETRKRDKAARARADQLADLETRIAACENAIRQVEAAMSAPGFYDDRAAAQPVIDRHQALMWQLGDLMHQWEELQSASDLTPD